MTISAKIIEHSVAAAHGKPLITAQLRYPRFIHAELMTHRVFSRNASSSRAIPVAKMIEEVLTNPAMPIHWGKNQAGMQAREENNARVFVPTFSRPVDGEHANDHINDWHSHHLVSSTVEEAWRAAAENAAIMAEKMAAAGYHKQVVNRILEPFLHISVILTFTEYDNWLELRKHPDAQPEIHRLAVVLDDAIKASTPVVRTRNRTHESGWHLPYVTGEERCQYENDPLFLAQLSSARCARVSYLNHDGSAPVIEKDIQLYLDLVGGRPLHASPVEHQGYPLPLATQQSKNFFGWRQHRELVEHAIYGPK